MNRSRWGVNHAGTSVRRPRGFPSASRVIITSAFTMTSCSRCASAPPWPGARRCMGVQKRQPWSGSVRNGHFSQSIHRDTLRPLADWVELHGESTLQRSTLRPRPKTLHGQNPECADCSVCVMQALIHLRACSCVCAGLIASTVALDGSAEGQDLTRVRNAS